MSSNLSSLKGKKILLAVTGSIAAYKSAYLTRSLIKNDADVKILLTPSAIDFITPLTLATLSRNPVMSDISTNEGWNNHVELGLWADLFIVAPATANTLAKMANGLCDNLVLAAYLSARCPVWVAPAMDLDMWKHPATVQNLENLKKHGVHIIDVEHGELASGLVGKGRMAEPDAITAKVADFFFGKNQPKPLADKHILVTAGPTQEALDPVRFITNHSSGKMGVAVAEELANQGARVSLVMGPGTATTFADQIDVINVVSAQQMHDAAVSIFEDADGAILAAAVADYKPATQHQTKMKKKEGDLQLALERTPDIAMKLNAEKKDDQFLIGFALETNNALENAQRKLEKKGFDFIVLNTLEDKGAGFGHNTNKITLLGKDNTTRAFELKSKKEAAKDIVNHLIETV